jgi:hypothetical protein
MGSRFDLVDSSELSAGGPFRHGSARGSVKEVSEVALG